MNQVLAAAPGAVEYDGEALTVLEVAIFGERPLHLLLRIGAGFIVGRLNDRTGFTHRWLPYARRTRTLYQPDEKPCNVQVSQLHLSHNLCNRSGTPRSGRSTRPLASRRAIAPLCARPPCIDIVYTRTDIPTMPKVRASHSQPRRAEPAAATTRAAASDPRASVNLRIAAGTRRLIDDAAAILGKTRTEFMVESARRQAVDVLLDQRLLTLDADGYDAFLHALDHPPAPGAKLTALMRRVPAWRT